MEEKDEEEEVRETIAPAAAAIAESSSRYPGGGLHWIPSLKHRPQGKWRSHSLCCGGGGDSVCRELKRRGKEKEARGGGRSGGDGVLSLVHNI